VETASNGTAKDDKNVEQPKLQESSEQNNLKPGSEVSSENKKRKLEALEGGLIKKCKNGTLADTENGEVIQGEKAGEKKIKWKKFIKAALKTVCVLNLGITSFFVFCLIYLYAIVICICLF
jgi:hypothetical protein